MDGEELTATLEEAGLSPYEAAAYVTLLDLGQASATDVAEASTVPGPRIYDVVRSLADEGYVETYERDTLRVRAHSPAAVLDDLRDRADRFDAAADAVEERWDQPELERNEASVVKRFETVVDRARSFVDDATHAVQLSATASGIDRLRDALDRAHDRDVLIDISVQTDPGTDPPPESVVAGQCTEARHRDLPAPFLLLVDRQKSCFAHQPGSFDQYGVLINDRTHSFVFHWYFLTCLWEGWPTIYSERNAEPPIEYVDVRRFVREMRPVVEAGGRVAVTVDGYDVDDGGRRTVTGTVGDLPAVNTTDPAPPLPGRATVPVRTHDGVVSVGGWGAVVEDVEAASLVVDAVDHDGPPEPTERDDRPPFTPRRESAEQD